MLRRGVTLGDGPTRPAEVERLVEPPVLPERPVPIRFRKSVPTAWLRMSLREGRNRQVRRMTAAVGHPTLRLVRVAIGPVELGGLIPGQWRELDAAEHQALHDLRDPEPARQLPSPITSPSPEPEAVGNFRLRASQRSMRAILPNISPRQRISVNSGDANDSGGPG